MYLPHMAAVLVMLGSTQVLPDDAKEAMRRAFTWVAGYTLEDALGMESLQLTPEGVVQQRQAVWRKDEDIATW
jgi:hypothetical protein